MSLRPTELADPLGRPRTAAETTALVFAALALQLLVWAILIYLLGVRHVWYGFHAISDTRLYHYYALRIAGGLRPYLDFPFEYPPLALPLLTLPGHLGTLSEYQRWFSAEMIVLCAAAAAVTAAAAAHLWRGLGRPLGAVIAFAAATFFTGAIIANRYDMAVALVIAAFLYCASRRWWVGAGAVIGVGFALKLTPALLLPLVFVLAATRRRALWAAVAFGLLAVIPFLPYLLRGGHGLSYVITYNTKRPLQLESLLATPYLIGKALGLTHVTVGSSFGSQFVSAPGAHALATLSPWLSLAALAVVYGLVWRRRALLRAAPSAVPAIALAIVLAFICTNKVLSPQYMIWTMPLVALVAAGEGRGRRALGMLCLAAMLLTQIEFPARYWRLVALHRSPIEIVAARNLLLLVAAVLAAVLIWRLPAEPPPAEPQPSEPQPSEPQPTEPQPLTQLRRLAPR